MKKKIKLLFLFSLLSLTSYGQTNDFNDKPWTKDTYPSLSILTKAMISILTN
ncbi:MAG: hypothetical protein ABI426_07215 [Flavobacterium sp.]